MTKEIIDVIEPSKLLEVLTIDSDGNRHRRSFAPGHDVSTQSPEVQAAAAENWTPEVVAAYQDAQSASQRGGLSEEEFRVSQISTECRRRIYAIASAETQMNMAATASLVSAKTAAQRSDAEAGLLVGFQAALDWVQAMRGAVQPLVVNMDADIYADASWPDVPPEVIAVVAQF